MKNQEPPLVIERFADNGEHSHYVLIGENANILWEEEHESQYKEALEEIKSLLPINSNILLSRKIESILKSAMI